MIDDSGKAVLSNDFFASFGKCDDSTIKKEEEPVKHEQAENVMTSTRLVHSNSVIGIESVYQQEEKSNHQQQQEEEEQEQGTPKMNTTSIPVPSIPLRRYNSDLTGITTTTILQNQVLSSISESSIIPQTPKDSYFNAANLGTGLTPIFNLTPQFNSLMYSMMNINSPKRGGSAGNGVNLITPDFFSSQQQEQRSQLQGLEEEARLETSTVTMNELMGQTVMKEKAVNDSVPSSSSSNGGGAQTSGWSSSEDSGDARLAL
ncbi:uncharacterized protein SPAPADRAFT_60138, partial [Spathaspora passalidarum NRRL Y-27907]